MIGTIALAAQAALGIGQAIGGWRKKNLAPDIPTYSVPEEAYANLSQAQRMALEGLPEEQKREYIENIQRTGAMSLQQAGERKFGMGLIGGIAQQQQDAYRSLLSADAQARMENQQNVMRMRDRIIEEKVRQFGSERDKSMILRGEADELLGAGIQNIGGSLGSFASLSSMFGGESLWNRKKKTATQLPQGQRPLEKIASIPGSVSL